MELKMPVGDKNQMVVRLEGGYKQITIESLEKLPPAKRRPVRSVRLGPACDFLSFYPPDRSWRAGPDHSGRCDGHARLGILRVMSAASWPSPACSLWRSAALPMRSKTGRIIASSPEHYFSISNGGDSVSFVGPRARRARRDLDRCSRGNRNRILAGMAPCPKAIR